nr:hypothetical protein [Ureaplasma urealyticum]
MPTKVLKEKPVVGKNFFIERKGKFYDACYGFAGQDLVVNTLNKWTRGANAQKVVDDKKAEKTTLDKELADAKAQLDKANKKDPKDQDIGSNGK